MSRKDRAAKREKMKARQESETTRITTKKSARMVLDISGYDEVKRFKMDDKKSSKQEIDIIPYVISSENHPDYPAMEIGEEDYKLAVSVHRGIGTDNLPVVCLKETYSKKCPICEERQSLMDGGKEWDDKEVSAALKLADKRRAS